MLKQLLLRHEIISACLCLSEQIEILLKDSGLVIKVKDSDVDLTSLIVTCVDGFTQALEVSNKSFEDLYAISSANDSE